MTSTITDRAEIAPVNPQTGTSYTLLTTDSNQIVTLSNALAVTVTLPNDMKTGYITECIQIGAGQVTFTAASGATLVNRSSQYKIAGQYGAAQLVVISNSDGESAIYVLAGDTAT